MDRPSPPPGSSARSTFNRFRDSMPDRFNTLQNKIESKIAQVPDKLSQVTDNLSQVPDKLSQVPDKFQDFRRETYNQLPKSISPPSAAKAPEEGDPKYDHVLAGLAAKILYRAGACPVSGGPLLVLCAASFPDTGQVDYNELLPYVLSILPGDDELGEESDSGGYSVVFFAGGGNASVGGKEGGVNAGKGNRPSWAWTLQAYHLLGRAVRKRIRKLWVVHERAWVRVILEVMAGVVSVKFRKKVVHLNTLTDLANHIDITQLHIPPAVYLHDRKLAPTITIPDPPPPIFGSPPFHTAANPPRVGENMPLPQVLVDTARYLRSKCLSVEGLFRVTPSQALLHVVREAYDRKQYIKWDEWGPHIAAALVKLYYRSLPQPLIPVKFYQDLLSLEEAGVSDEKAFLKVKDLLQEDGLPKSSRVLLLRHLFPLLALVAQNSAVNKMNPNNLAVCVAPSLLKSDDMMADAKACNGLRTFIQIAVERVEELAPELPNRGSPVRSGSGSGSSITRVLPPSGSPPPYSVGSIQPVQRKKLPGIMGTKEMEGGMTARKPLPGSVSSSITYLPLASEPDEKKQLIEKTEAEEQKEDIRPPSTPGLSVKGEAPRRGSVPSIPTKPGEGIMRRKASFQSFTKSPPEIGPKPPILSSSSIIPDPSPYLSTSSSPITKPPRVIRRAASSTFPSSSSLRSSSFSSPSVANIANSLNQSQMQTNIQLKSKTPPPQPLPPATQRAKTDVGSMKGRGKGVEELRALYEERAKGVEVLVRNTPGRLKGRGKG
ncbi:RhoGAP-domain-containing protein [Choiromyces venosus 120613-1]|uniref:RhoGAP-domain-containing protein n=1 Tax=Choiromyces venosus 120613-1 TaxID=1336337 RepID=A0A3N4JI21_9PEZI|nr:RhoGAP-domain-containing protein [Choiromyces venosus 120613-1]